jgi:membrane-bound serine protease (ClpP class)
MDLFLPGVKGTMNLLLDPNVAYLILVVGFVLGVLALFTPGTGILEIGALFAIFLAGYAVYSLPINLWALILLVVGVIPFLVALRKSKQWLFLIPAILSIVIGSIFLFRLENGAPAINPALAIVTSIVAIGLLWLIGRKGIDALLMAPSQDLSKLVGLVGEARTDVKMEGTVYVSGEEWTARSEHLIRQGSRVRVTGREGLVLLVEKAD